MSRSVAVQHRAALDMFRLSLRALGPTCCPRHHLLVLELVHFARLSRPRGAQFSVRGADWQLRPLMQRRF
jgi:hypothetical protein